MRVAAYDVLGREGRMPEAFTGIKPGETPTYSAGIREVQYLPLVWG